MVEIYKFSFSLQLDFGDDTCLDRLSWRPLKPAKDWLLIIPLGPPGENEWDPTDMISGDREGISGRYNSKNVSQNGMVQVGLNQVLII